MEFGELHITDDRHDVAVKAALDFIGATQASSMFLDVAGNKVANGHRVGSATTRIAAIGNSRLSF
jgi:hypothetical protein